MAHLVKFLTQAPEVVVLLLYLVVPGFVFIRVYDLLAPDERRSTRSGHHRHIGH